MAATTTVDHVNQKVGILTGISYVSGIDYFKGIHERVLAKTPKGHLMPPNPPMVMASVDCDAYVNYLNMKAFDQVADYLLAGVDKLVAADCNLLVIASNTGHICVPVVEEAHPDLDILHIADCLAFQLKQEGLTKVALVGTKPTMEEDFFKARLLRHGITAIVPEDKALQEEMYRIIYEELSFNDFRDESRSTMVEVIRGLVTQGAEACILGCTEIELLVQQQHVPELPLLPSAEIHIQATAELLLGNLELANLLPPDEVS
jgi:aspartate racemase